MSEDIPQKVKQVLGTGRLKASRAAPYLQSVFLGFVPIATRSVPTCACTPDMRFYYNPDYVRFLSPEEVAFLWWHEAMHIILHHSDRRGNRDHLIWNVAGDLFINDQRPMQLRLPDGGVLPSKFQLPPNLSADEYYQKLIELAEEHSQNQPGGPGEGGSGGQGGAQGGGGQVAENTCPPGSPQNGPSRAGQPEGTGTAGPGQTGQEGANQAAQEQTAGPGLTLPGLEAPGVASGGCGSCAGHQTPGEPETGEAASGGRSEAEVEQLRRQVAEEVRREAEAGRGNIPGGLKLWADAKLGKPKVPWQRKLRKVCRRAITVRPGAVDYRYSAPSKRQAGVGYGPGRAVMPGLIQPIPQVAFVLDTSGSMGPARVKAALEEAIGIIKSVGAEVQFCACDAAVHEIAKVKNGKELLKLVTGGGGTDFRPAFKALAQSTPKPELVVFATDGAGPAPAVEPKGMKVIWLLVDHYSEPATWGTKIEINTRESQS